MNERIKLLADQAELTVRTSIGTYMSHPEFNKKFAELIVKECLAQIDKVRDSCDGNEAEQELGAVWAGLAVARHFGVEE